MGKADEMSTAEVFRIYREFKRIQKEAGITPPRPDGQGGNPQGPLRGRLRRQRCAPPAWVAHARRRAAYDLKRLCMYSVVCFGLSDWLLVPTRM